MRLDRRKRTLHPEIRREVRMLIRPRWLVRVALLVSLLGSLALGQLLESKSRDLFGGFRSGWDENWMTRKLASRSTRFDVVVDSGERVLRATSDASASAFSVTRCRTSENARALLALESRVEPDSKPERTFEGRRRLRGPRSPHFWVGHVQSKHAGTLLCLGGRRAGRGRVPKPSFGQRRHHRPRARKRKERRMDSRTARRLGRLSDGIRSTPGRLARSHRRHRGHRRYPVIIDRLVRRRAHQRGAPE